MSDRMPRYPMPPVIRDTVEHRLREVPVGSRYDIRQLVALAYAYGFDAGELYGMDTAHRDQRDAAEEATDATT